MRTALASTLFSVLWVSAAFSQTVTIRATIQSQSDKEVVLRLDSGAAIVVPLVDVVDGAAVKTTAPPPPDTTNDAYRVARCRELTRSSTLIPQATRERELRELECDKVATAAPTAFQTAMTTYDVRQQCASEWTSDFQMRVFCEKQQQEALGTLQNRVMSTADRITIRKQCLTEWPRDYKMRNFCEEKQIKALGELGRK